MSDENITKKSIIELGHYNLSIMGSQKNTERKRDTRDSIHMCCKDPLSPSFIIVRLFF
jgi:hypothetical protein